MKQHSLFMPLVRTLILENFTYLGSVMEDNGRFRQKVLQWLGLAYEQCYGFPQYEYMMFLIPVQKDRSKSSGRLCSLSYSV